ncbi:hypothetical protein EON65_33345 [archaeon]|nr:MAG: hypothetical protein EON65_33345 [archaeon]
MNNESNGVSENNERVEKIKLTVNRLMRKVLPNHCVVDDAALEMMVKCVVELGSSLSCESINITSANSQGSVSGDSVVRALTDLGFDNYVNPIKSYLHHRIEHAKSCLSCLKPDLEIAPSIAPRKKPAASKDTSDILATKRGRPPKGDEKTTGSAKTASSSKAEAPSAAVIGEQAGAVEDTTSKGPPRKQHKKSDWTDPRCIEQFVRVMTDAMQTGKSEDEIVREVAKSMRMSIKDVRVR